MAAYDMQMPVRMLQEGLTAFARAESMPGPGVIDGLWGPATANSFQGFMSFYPAARRLTIEAPRRATTVRVPQFVFNDLRVYVEQYRARRGGRGSSPTSQTPGEIQPSPIPPGIDPPEFFPLPIPTMGGETQAGAATPPIVIPPPSSPGPAPAPPTQAGMGPNLPAVLVARDTGPKWGPVVLGVIGLGVVGGLVYWASKGGRR